MQVSDVTLCYKSKRNPTHHLNYGMNITSMSGALRKTNNPRRLTNGWRINKMTNIGFSVTGFVDNHTATPAFDAETQSEADAVFNERVSRGDMIVTGKQKILY